MYTRLIRASTKRNLNVTQRDVKTRTGYERMLFTFHRRIVLSNVMGPSEHSRDELRFFVPTSIVEAVFASGNNERDMVLAEHVEQRRPVCG